MNGNRRFDNKSMAATPVLYLLIQVVFLAWMHHLNVVSSTWSTEFIAGILGSAFRAVGVILYLLVLRFNEDKEKDNGPALILHILFFLFSLPAVYSKTITGNILYGSIMSLVGGFLMAFGLKRLLYAYRDRVAGVVFLSGSGIGLFISFVFILSARYWSLRGSFFILPFLVLSASSLFLMIRTKADEEPSGEPEGLDDLLPFAEVLMGSSRTEAGEGEAEEVSTAASPSAAALPEDDSVSHGFTDGKFGKSGEDAGACEESASKRLFWLWPLAFVCCMGGRILLARVFPGGSILLSGLSACVFLGIAVLLFQSRKKGIRNPEKATRFYVVLLSMGCVGEVVGVVLNIILKTGHLPTLS